MINMSMRYHQLVEYNRDITLTKHLDDIRKLIPANADATNALIEIETADPTKNKKYVVWIIKQLKNRLIRMEDLSRVTNLLTSFEQLKPRMPQEQRDIGKFTIHQLHDIIQGILNPDFDKEQHKKLDIEGLNSNEYELLYDGPLGTLVSPKTEHAACILGKGTQWCTAATQSNNAFDYYAREGKLFIWKDKTRKYQLHFETIQFMDMHDRTIDYGQLWEWRNSHPVLSPLFKKHEHLLGAANDNGDGHVTIDDFLLYSARAIQGRLPAGAEKRMLSSMQSEDEFPALLGYAEDYPEFADMLGKDLIRYVKDGLNMIEEIIEFAERIKGGRWDELEKLLLDSQITHEPRDIVTYALENMNSRWRDGEHAFLKLADNYLSIERDRGERTQWYSLNRELVEPADEYAREAMGKNNWWEWEELFNLFIKHGIPPEDYGYTG